MRCCGSALSCAYGDDLFAFGVARRDCMTRQKSTATQTEKSPPSRPWLTERDENILRAVLKYRFLLRDQIEALLFQSSTSDRPIAHARRVLNRRLAQLVAAGYLSASAVPSSPRHNARNTQYTYTLDNEGLAFLSREGIVSEEDLKRYKDRVKVTPSYTLHMQAENDFTIALMLGAKERGDEVVEWQSELELKKLREKVSHPDDQSITYPIRPDAYYRYLQAGKKEPVHFFLEIDRRTEDHKTIAKKVKGYIAYQKSGAFKERYGFTKFRVLFVTMTEENVKSLKRTTEAAGGERMFWFATTEALRTDRVLEEIWTVATVEGKAELFKSLSSS
jgi:hypothetical protein